MNNWLLLGPEAGEKQEFLSQIKAKLEKTYGTPLESYKFYPYESELSDILSLLKNGSLFSPHKLVVIDEAHDLKGKKNIPPLIEYLNNPSPEASLVLLSDQPGLDKKLEKAFGKNKKIFWEMFENQKQGWVQNYFHKNKYTISTEASQLILDLVENNTEALKRECERLILFCPQEQEITEETVEKFIFHSKEENVFTLFEKLASADLDGTLEIYKKIRLSGDANPVGLLSGLTWQIRNVLKVQYLRRQNFSLRDIYPKLAIRSKKNQKTYTTAIQNYRIADLENILAMAAEFDLRLKGARSELAVLQMELFFYYVIEKKGELLRA